MSKQEAESKSLWSPEKSQSSGDSVWVDVETDFTTIKDDVYWLEANVLLKRGAFDQSITMLEKIISEFGEDILSDDAYFLEGEIYEQQLKNKDKAMEIYREFLNKYPGSVYAAEARKRYRQLRGDFTEITPAPKF